MQLHALKNLALVALIVAPVAVLASRNGNSGKSLNRARSSRQVMRSESGMSVSLADSIKELARTNRKTTQKVLVSSSDPRPEGHRWLTQAECLSLVEPIFSRGDTERKKATGCANSCALAGWSVPEETEESSGEALGHGGACLNLCASEVYPKALLLRQYFYAGQLADRAVEFLQRITQGESLNDVYDEIMNGITDADTSHEVTIDREGVAGDMKHWQCRPSMVDSRAWFNQQQQAGTHLQPARAIHVPARVRRVTHAGARVAGGVVRQTPGATRQAVRGARQLPRAIARQTAGAARQTAGVVQQTAGAAARQVPHAVQRTAGAVRQLPSAVRNAAQAAMEPYPN